MDDAETRLSNLDAASKENIAMSEHNVKVSEETVQAMKTKDIQPKLKRGPRGPREDANHPRTAEMVNSAIVALNERGGSSTQAIKKYMAETYNIDTKKKALFIKKYLISAVNCGALYRTRGSGAAGSFRVCKVCKHDTLKKPEDKNIAKPALSKKAAIAKKPAIVRKPTAPPDLTKNAKKKEKVIAAMEKAAAAKKQAAADKKLAVAMKKLAAATKKATALKVK